MTGTPGGRRSRAIAALIACFYAGAFADWWLREKVARLEPVASATAPIATAGEPVILPAASPPGEAADTLQRRALRVPIDGMDVQTMKGSFDEHRTGAGGHEHDAVDILAPRNTAIHAVDEGTVAKLFYGKAGGTTIYQYDPSQRFCYYYAHLERYADGLRDGQKVSRGDVIGYVGTSGNAPPGTPHLHFAVYELTAEQRWWQGRAIDPYLVFRR